jgi:hypothetical protein
VIPSRYNVHFILLPIVTHDVGPNAISAHNPWLKCGNHP